VWETINGWNNDRMIVEDEQVETVLEQEAKKFLFNEGFFFIIECEMYDVPDGKTKFGEKCTAYIAGTCSKGAKCPYLHTRIKFKEVCKHWFKGVMEIDTLILSVLRPL
jgi:hypothetical protein